MNPEQCAHVGYHFGGYRLVENARRTMFLLLMLIVRVRLRWTLIRSIAITIVSAWLIVVIVTTSFAITPPLRLVVSLLLF